MKKFLAVLTAICLSLPLFLLTGCRQEEKKDGKISVVTTIFPVYDWVNNILGESADRVDLTLLLDNGIDLHSYRPSVEDLVKIAECDLFVYVGGESDAWAEDALKNAVNPDRRVLNLLDTLGDAAKEEETVEGMEGETHDEKDHDHDHDHESEKDEHVWLSLRNAKVLCRAIEKDLCAIDPENAASYGENLRLYEEALSLLDTEYTDAVREGKKDVLLFADRFPFRYLVDDYGLRYYAAFPGCSAETEASFATIAFLTGKVDELHLSCVLTLEGSDRKVAETVIAGTAEKNQRILALDSLQGITSADAAGGVSYLSVMKKNLDVLKLALS